MQKILITYADKKFELSKRQLLKEAKALGFFDRLIGYGPKDLPTFINASPLMAYKRGGGYWCWKPWIIWQTMQKYPEAIVVYIDAGCILHNSSEWNDWFQLMETHDALVTHYRENVDYGWQNTYPGRALSPAIEHWTKRNTLSYFDIMFGNTEWHQANKVWAGFVMAKNNSRLIKEWLDITLFYPRYVMDPIGADTEIQNKEFVDHRHDQSILTPLAYWLQKQDQSIVAIIPETGESETDAAIQAARRILKPIPLKTRIVNLIKKLLGADLYRKIYH